MHTLTDRKRYADFLEGIPAFSSCAKEVLEEFACRRLVKVHCAAGKRLNPLTDQEQNLYVLATGSALLKADDDLAVALSPGDYFGKSPGRRHHIVASVVAVSDIDVLVITPKEVARLKQAPSRARATSQVDRPKASGTDQWAFRPSHRRGALAYQGV